MAKIWLLAGDYYLWFSGDRVLEILVKQHADMSLFVKHIVDKQQFQDLYFALKIEKKTGLLIFYSLREKKLIFNFFVNSNWKKLTDSLKRAKILDDNRKSHHPIETLFDLRSRWILILYLVKLFWRHWREEFLATLNTQMKWREATDNLKVGNVVFVVD